MRRQFTSAFGVVTYHTGGVKLEIVFLPVSVGGLGRRAGEQKLIELAMTRSMLTTRPIPALCRRLCKLAVALVSRGHRPPDARRGLSRQPARLRPLDRHAAGRKVTEWDQP